MHKEKRAAAPLLFFFVLLGTAMHAAADESATAPSLPPKNACELLQKGALAPWGYDAALSQELVTQVSVKKGEANAPSDVDTNMCFIYKDKAQKTGSAVVMVESFAPEIEAAAITGWIKEVAAQEKTSHADMKFEESVVGGTPCEIGNYLFQEADDFSIVQHYVACDRVVGKRHITINVQQPDSASGLPTTVDVKTLLDQAAARLVLLP